LISKRTVTVVLLIFSTACFKQEAATDWNEPFPPYRVIGNIYYVGTGALASFLIHTSSGDILINSDLENSVPLIRQNVNKLGFQFSNIKILLISHAHFDHCAGSSLVKKLTGAKYMVMDRDVPVVEDGGRSDFQYGHSPKFYFPSAKVDRVLHDNDTVTLGGVMLVAHLTPGHTKGCTTWTLKTNEQGKTYDAVIIGSPNVNPGYKLINNAEYPQIASDFKHTFAVLKSLHCDVFLGAHGSYYGMEQKYARLNQTGGTNPFIDPAGYVRYVSHAEQAFYTELRRQSEKKQ
jgi:metallo-beta-lactamase class B